MPLITTRDPEQLDSARVPEQGREAVAAVVSEPAPLARNTSNKARQLAEQKFKPTGEKRPTSVKLDVWLDDALNAKVYELRLLDRQINRNSFAILQVRELRAMMLNSVASELSKRNYAKPGMRLFALGSQGLSSSFMAYRAGMLEKKLSVSAMNVRLFPCAS